MIFLGTEKVETTVVDKTELVDYLGPKGNFSIPSPLTTLSFTTMTNCTVSINGSDPIYVPSNATLEFGKEDARIESFVINGKGVQYVYIATT